MKFDFKKWFGAKVIFEDGLFIKLRFYKWYILNINIFVNIEESEIKSLGISNK